MRKGEVNLNEYKAEIYAVIDEYFMKGQVGSITESTLRKVLSMLRCEEYCMERGIEYADMTEDDFEDMYMREIDKKEEMANWEVD